MLGITRLLIISNNWQLTTQLHFSKVLQTRYPCEYNIFSRFHTIVWLVILIQDSSNIVSKQNSIMFKASSETTLERRKKKCHGGQYMGLLTFPKYMWSYSIRLWCSTRARRLNFLSYNIEQSTPLLPFVYTKQTLQNTIPWAPSRNFHN